MTCRKKLFPSRLIWREKCKQKQHDTKWIWSEARMETHERILEELKIEYIELAAYPKWKAGTLFQRTKQTKKSCSQGV